MVAVFKNRSAEIARDKLCRNWFDEAPQDDPAKRAFYYDAAWAVGNTNPRSAVLARTLMEACAKDEQNDPSIKWHFMDGAKMGLTKAIEFLKPHGYTVKDFDKWGWLPDDPEQRPARLAEFGALNAESG